ncbi:MAG TPA: phenylalanine--tRNA ligase subunit beta, partial [Euryarchaeota archaeon]|nr:phenylalanine--tRNA ligase subunit beta [Euryarchaeota archaeon]
MPKYEIRKGDLERLVGRSFTLEELEDVFFDIKAELDDVDGDLITVEYSDTNRPDMWSVEGLAREIRGYLGLETGCPKYAVGPPAGELRVDPSVKKIRPFVAAAVVRGVRLGEEGYEQLIQLQEKIMLTYGRKRRRVAIGTHNADMISFPVKYSAVDPESVRFVPLWETRELTLSEILEKTEKGREYAHLLDGFDKYPVIVDDNGRVISFPPIINS